MAESTYNYGHNQEFRKVFGQELVEYDDVNKSDINSPMPNNDNSSTQMQNIVENINEQNIQQEIIESKIKFKKLKKKSLIVPTANLILAILGMVLALTGAPNLLILAIYGYLLGYNFLTLSSFTVNKSKYGKESAKLFELRKTIIGKHFENNKQFSNIDKFDITSPYYDGKAGKIIVEKDGYKTIYKFKMIVNEETGHESPQIRRVS